MKLADILKVAGQLIKWLTWCLFIPSEDYAYNFVQWQIGVGSMWSEAIGLAPLKDRSPAPKPTLTIRSESGQP